MMKTVEKKIEKRTKKRNEARHWFLTLSQTQLTVQEVYDKLLAEDKLEHLAVVLETHTKDVNKGKHIHVYLSYLKKRDLSLRHFDFLQNGVHVEKVKNTDSLLAYMNKENECKANFDVWRQLLGSKRKFAQTLASMIELGYDLDEIQIKYCKELADKPWATVARFISEVKALKAKPTTKGLSDQLRWITRDLIEARLTPKELELFDSDPQFQTLVDYINKVKKFGSRQIHKACCLSIVSEPSTGKTSLLLKLAEHYNSYEVPSDGWHKHYKNHFYSMWTWNEWSFSDISMEEMLKLTEGFSADMRVKGSKTFKEDRPMLFLLCNETWQDKYERRFSYLKRINPYVFRVRREAFSVRIKELNFGKQNLFFLQKLFVGVIEDVNLRN